MQEDQEGQEELLTPQEEEALFQTCMLRKLRRLGTFDESIMPADNDSNQPAIYALEPVPIAPSFIAVSRPEALPEESVTFVWLAPALPLTEIEQGSVTHLLDTLCRPPATLQWSETQPLASDSCSECRFLSLTLLFSHTLCCGISMSVIGARPLLWMLCM
jgi:hypothetical protein